MQIPSRPPFLHTRARPYYEHQAKSQDHDVNCRLKICGLALLLIGVIVVRMLDACGFPAFAEGAEAAVAINRVLPKEDGLA